MNDPFIQPSALILLVEDDTLQAESLEFLLRQEGYAVQTVGTGEGCLRRMREQPLPDLVVLDVNLPDLGGIEVTRRLRAVTDVPLVMLTARQEQTDKVVGLDTGADDYVTKPFDTHEFLARLRARLRRRPAPAQSRSGSPGVIMVGDLHVDIGARRVERQGRVIPLSAREFDILRILAEANGHVVERHHLFSSVWGADYLGHDRALDVYVRLLRRKIEPEPSRPRYLHTVRGVGYRLADDPDFLEQSGTDGSAPGAT